MKFESAKDMYEEARDCDLYNKELELYVFGYNDFGALCYYHIDEEEAEELRRKSRENDDEYWGAFLGIGGYVLDDMDFYPEDYDEDNEKCKIKREELLRLLPKKECLKYFNLENEEEINKYKIKPLIFEIEKYIDVYGEDLLKTAYRHYIGNDIVRILDENTSLDDKKKYIKEINDTNESILFSNPDDVEGCIEFLKEKVKLIERE